MKHVPPLHDASECAQHAAKQMCIKTVSRTNTMRPNKHCTCRCVLQHTQDTRVTHMYMYRQEVPRQAFAQCCTGCQDAANIILLITQYGEANKSTCNIHKAQFAMQAYMRMQCHHMQMQAADCMVGRLAGQRWNERWPDNGPTKHTQPNKSRNTIT